jgi:hypothetical protein
MRHGNSLTAGVYFNAIFQFGSVSQFFSQTMSQEIYEVFFYVFPEKMRGDLDCQDIVLEFQWHNGFKPCIET